MLLQFKHLHFLSVKKRKKEKWGRNPFYDKNTVKEQKHF